MSDIQNFDKMVDAVLAYNKTPRSHLFEYPYREDESLALIRSAENLVNRILQLSP